MCYRWLSFLVRAGGIVFVHSGLIEAVGGSKQALSFVGGHEVSPHKEQLKVESCLSNGARGALKVS